jgi:hypothetical protein
MIGGGDGVFCGGVEVFDGWEEVVGDGLCEGGGVVDDLVAVFRAVVLVVIEERWVEWVLFVRLFEEVI